MATSTTTKQSGRAPAPPGRYRPWPLMVATAVVAAVVSGFIGYAAGRPAQPDPTSIEGIAATLSAEHEAEHRRMTEELTGAVWEVYDELMVVLADMHEVLPVGEPVSGASGTPEQADAWRSTTASAIDRLSTFGLGTPSYNATHGSLFGAVRQLDVAARTYEQALQMPDPGRQSLAELAADQRDSAADLWAVGAEQLDELNIAADLGHVHLFLPATGDPDSIPQEFREGSNSH